MGVAFFALGGTISMAGADGGSVTRLGAAQLAAAVPGLAELGVALDVRDIDAVPSGNLTFAQVLDVVDRAADAVSRGAAGVVVSQGTDTMEETAFLADLVWDRPEPLVFTGAMRNPTLAGPDGPANLLAAVAVAADPAARDLGVLLVFADEVHAARWARKTHSTSTATFASPNTGPLGHVVERRVRLLGGLPRPAALPRPDPGALAAVRVGLHTVTLDDDAAWLAGLADTHQGLVVAGFGVGHVPAALAPCWARSPSGSRWCSRRGPARARCWRARTERSVRSRTWRGGGCSTAGSCTRTRLGCCCGCCWRAAPTGTGSPRSSPNGAEPARAPPGSPPLTA